MVMTFVLGAYKAQCDRCGWDFLNRKLVKEWTGLRVCKGPGTNECWEPRHPQEKLRGKVDRQAPPWVRPENEGPDVSPGSGNEVEPGDL